jgi:hypothetical protein
MKKLIASFLVIVFISFFSSQATAQKRGAHADARLQKRVQEMKVQLNLTDEQVTKITAVLKNARQKMAAARAAGGDSTGMAAKRKAINKNTQHELKLVLTTEQVEKWKALRKSKKQGKMDPEQKE